MRKKLIICDNSLSLGRLVMLRAVNLGISADCCRNNPASIQAAISDESCGAALIFAFSADEQLLSIVKQAADKGIPVFTGIFSASSAAHRAFRNAGAAAAFMLPCSVRNICKAILLRIGSSGDLYSQMRIFLEETGFPHRLKGFGYLAAAAAECLKAPEKLWDSMNSVYSDTAEMFSTNASLVERAMRNLGAHAAQNGSLARLTDGRLAEKPTNTELICAACDMFARC